MASDYQTKITMGYETTDTISISSGSSSSQRIDVPSNRKCLGTVGYFLGGSTGCSVNHCFYDAINNQLCIYMVNRTSSTISSIYAVIYYIYIDN